ncbi:MAG: YihY/virulence factor BrkB family protein [Verrucomicrobiota bacterium]|nr:YihY/virulence factor BrkB family protein [Verrucomicrobiota bacterium]
MSEAPETLRGKNIVGTTLNIFKETFRQWLEDKAPQLGAALAYYTVFSLAPLILVLLAILGLIFRNDPAGAWERMTTQLGYFLDRSAIDVIRNIAQKAARSSRSCYGFTTRRRSCFLAPSSPKCMRIISAATSSRINTPSGSSERSSSTRKLKARPRRPDFRLSKQRGCVTFTDFSQGYGLRNYQNRRQTVSRRRR